MTNVVFLCQYLYIVAVFYCAIIQYMIVYVEIVLLDNFIMTMLICLLVFSLGRYRIRWIEIVLVCILGSVISLLYPFLPFNGILLLGYRVVVGIVLGLILMYRQSRKMLGIVCFLVCTVGMGGIVFALRYFVYGEYSSSVVTPSLVWIIVGCGFVVYWIGKSVFLRYHKMRDSWIFESRALVYVGNKELELNGFVDSGNKLYFGGQPVALLPKSKINFDSNSNKYMSINTVAGDTKIPIIFAKKIVLYTRTSINILYNVPIGLTDSKFDGFDILLPPAALAT